MNIPHCNPNICMSKHPLKYQDIAVVRHETRREGVAHFMRKLPSRCFDTGALHGFSES